MSERIWDAILLTNRNTYLVGAVKADLNNPPETFIVGVRSDLHPYKTDKNDISHILIDLNRETSQYLLRWEGGEKLI